MLTRYGMAFGMLIGLTGLAAAAPPPAVTVATVDGDKITQADLDAECLIRRIPPEEQAAHRDAVLKDLIDRRLIAAFLDDRKAPVPESELTAQVELLKRAVEDNSDSFAEVIAKLGLTEQSLKAALAQPLRWKAYVRRTVTDQQLRDYFEIHRAEFDGTQVRARQIVLSVPATAADADWEAAATRLEEIRQSILNKSVSFEDAARQYSTSPSAKQGGDLGFFAFRGRLPPVLSSAAFALPPDGISEVIRSPFGVHLLQVTDRKPGDYSLEDVREEVWDQRTREIWNEQVAAARQTARINVEAPAPN
ncbi:MAG: peptidylprolyl isomerase [Planctomycetaceae bacterium]|nr:peptidylprolyl isomerase [Planctomycetaceae bacterium]